MVEPRILSGTQFELIANKVVVGAATSYERCMVARLYYFASVDYDDAVGISDRGKTVSYDHYCATLIETVQILYYGTFVFGVE